jgi:hypothetical protein
MSILTFESEIHFDRRGSGARREIVDGPAPPVPIKGRLPRITRLMALAIHFDGLIRDGAIGDYAELARLGHVSRARITQVMNLLMLAPDIQEEILFRSRILRGDDGICVRHLQPIALTPDWKNQRRMWRQLRDQHSPHQ